VRSELLNILECPACQSPHLHYAGAPDAAEQSLSCERCGQAYGFEHNIPLLYQDDAFWAPKRREALGWVEMWRDLGDYDKEVPLLIDLPFIPGEPWETLAVMFRAALFQMDLTGEQRILDIGAGQGWAAQRFAQLGCHAVAIDICADPVFGLGRAWERMARSGCPYDLLIGDNERLPFQPNTFDIVFSSNTLHHSDYIDLLFKSAYRILRPGGRLIAIGDPLTTIFQQEDDVHDGDREKAYGILERRRRFYHYVLPMWRAGFRNIHAEDQQTFWKTSAELYPWMDQQRQAIEGQRLLGTTLTTQLLTALMLRLPRPFAVGLLLSIRPNGLLLLSGRKPE
jgi:SAM-dependent methyltransferase